MNTNNRQVTPQRVSRSLNGQIKALFKTDYHMLRLAGLNRQQAWRICASKYIFH